MSLPYSNLTPDLIFAAIEKLGLECSGGLFALNSYENRVYQLGMENAPPLIAKFYRPNRWSTSSILEEHQFAIELSQQEIPVIAPLILQENSLHHHEGYHFALFERRSGRALEFGNADHLTWMGRFIGRIHAIGACQTFQNRLQLNAETFGQQSLRFLIDNEYIPTTLFSEFKYTVSELLKRISEKFQNLQPGSFIRLHGDCHPGNILWNDNGPHIVDLDDCLMGPAVQDLWMLLAGDEFQTESQLQNILKGYREFHDFDYREIDLIPSLRALRILNYAAWLAKRWDDPTFPIHFPFFNTNTYWYELLENLKRVFPEN